MAAKKPAQKKSADPYRIEKKRSGRYAVVRKQNGQYVNGQDKIKILVDKGLVKATAKKAPAAEAAPEGAAPAQA